MSENPVTSSGAPARVAPRVTVRHLQLMRAALALLAAVMITFSADHSASYGLAVFSGFAVATALVLGFGAWMAYPAGRRATPAALAVVSVLAGMVGGIPPWRTTEMFFWLIIAWAAITGVIELASGQFDRLAMKRDGIDDAQRRSDARDGIVVGILGVLLAVGILLVRQDFHLDYFIADADAWFVLEGIAIAVGLFGAYAAIVAVYLGIAGLSPRRASDTEEKS